MSKCGCGRLWSHIEFCVTGCIKSSQSGENNTEHDDPPSPVLAPHSSNSVTASSNNIIPTSADPAAPFRWDPPSPITMELLDKLLELLDKKLGTHGASDSASTATINVNDYLTSVDALLQGLPTDKKKVMQDAEMMAKDSLLPILSQVLQGVGSLHWATMGCALLAWAIEARYGTQQNSEDCLDILCRIQSLLRSMRAILRDLEQPTPHADIGMEVESTLRRVVEMALKAVVLCDSCCQSRARFFKATFLKDLVANLKEQTIFTQGQITSIRSSIQHPNAILIKRQPSYLENNDDRIVGRDKEKDDAIRFLSTSYASEVRALCLHGMGGIGKSTLGLAIFEEFQRKRNGAQHFVCCREELPLDVKESELPQYQKAILEKVSNNGNIPNISNTLDDNLLSRKHVQELLPTSTYLPQGFRILVTTRHRGVAESLQNDLGIENCYSMEMKQLERSVAESLLMQEVFKSPDEVEMFNAIRCSWPYNLAVLTAEELSTMTRLRCLHRVKIENGAEGEGESSSCSSSSAAATTVPVVLPNLRLVEDVRGFKSIDFEACSDLRAIVDCSELSAALRGTSVSKTLRYIDHSFKATINNEQEDVEAIAGCRELWHLHLMGSRNLTCLPSHLARNLSALRSLSLSDCMRLEDLIEEESAESSCLRNLTRLTSLTLDRCRRLRRLPEGIGHLTALQRLNLEACEVLEDVPQGISLLSALQVLAFVECKQLRTLPGATFRHMTGLQELRMERCESLESMPKSISQCKALRKLRLSECQKLRSLPHDMFTEHMTDLRELDLPNCSNLEGLPHSISGLKNLEKVYLNGCRNLEVIPESISQLSKLEVLNLSHCSKLRSLPRAIFFHMATSLRVLILDNCRALVGVGVSPVQSPMQHESLTAATSSSAASDQQDASVIARFSTDSTAKQEFQGLNILDVSYCRRLQIFPHCRFQRLTELKLAGCFRVALEQLLHHSDQVLHNLTSLDLSNNHQIRHLPEAILSSALRVLTLGNCKNLQCLPHTPPLTNLETLDLSNCIRLESIPQYLICCTSLKYLTLGGCSKLQGFLNDDNNNLQNSDKPQWINLEDLNLRNCSSLRSISEWICSDLSSLSTLDLSGCTQLQRLHQKVFQQKTDLLRLNMKDCDNLQFLPDSVSELKSLNFLNLSGCSKLATLPERMFQDMTALHFLDLSDCVSLTELPKGNLPRLLCLYLKGCKNLRLESLHLNTSELNLSGINEVENLPETIFQNMTTNLQDLRLKDCSGLQRLPDSICGLTNLFRLDLSGCRGLRTLPQHMLRRMKSLRSLSLEGCSSINLERGGRDHVAREQDRGLEEEAGMNDLEHLGSVCVINDDDMKELERLDLSGNEKLISNLSSLNAFQQMSNLQSLTIRECSSLPCLPDSILQLRYLEELDISGWRSLQRLPESVMQSSEIQRLRLCECISLKSLPCWVCELRNLRVLDLSGCSMLQSLPLQLFRNTSALRWLYLSDCGNLNSLPKEGLSTLEHLRVRGCNNLGLESLLCGESSAVGRLTSLDLSNNAEFCNMNVLPQNLFEHMSNLGTLRLEGYSRLQCLPESICRLCKLEKLDLSGCKELQNLPPESVLEGLRKLVLKDCVSLTQMPDGVVEELKRLHYSEYVCEDGLNVEGCGEELTSLIFALEETVA